MKNKTEELFEQKTFFSNLNWLYLKELFTDDKKNTAYLVGGAIIDILNRTEPKDFDLIVAGNFDYYIGYLFDKGLSLKHVTKTAYTFFDIVNNKYIQILKTNPNEFDYTINKAQIHIKSNYISYFDRVSYLTRVLIPTEYAFNNKSKQKECLNRVSKMEEKGIYLPDMTKKSLKGRFSILDFFFGQKES